MHPHYTGWEVRDGLAGAMGLPRPPSGGGDRPPPLFLFLSSKDTTYHPRNPHPHACRLPLRYTQE